MTAALADHIRLDDLPQFEPTYLDRSQVPAFRSEPPRPTKPLWPFAPGMFPDPNQPLNWADLPQILKAQQLADFLHMGYGSLLERLRMERHQIEHGYKPGPANPIPVHRMGRRFRFDRDEIRSWFEREGRE